MDGIWSVGADFMSCCREDEDELYYHYWGGRCLALAERTGRPRLAKRDTFWQWLSKRSGAEYIMLVTAISTGIGRRCLAITLGVEMEKGDSCW
jgi:hypothetical protein